MKQKTLSYFWLRILLLLIAAISAWIAGHNELGAGIGFGWAIRNWHSWED